MTEAARTINGTQYSHQDTQSADTMKTIGMCCQPTHSMERNRIPYHTFMLITPGVCPGNRQFNLLITRSNSHFMGQLFNRFCWHTGNRRGPFRGIILDPVNKQLESWFNWHTIFQFKITQQVGISTLRMCFYGTIHMTVPPEFILRIDTGIINFFWSLTDKQTILVTVFFHINQFCRIGVLDQEVTVIQTLLDNFINDGQNQGTIRTGSDRHPFIGNGRIAGAYRINGDKTPTVTLKFG